MRVAVLVAVVSACVPASAPAASTAPSQQMPGASQYESLTAPSPMPAPTSTAGTPTPSLSRASSTSAHDVLDAALAAIRGGTIRYEAETHNEGGPRLLTATGRGEVAFGEPPQFRVVNDEITDIDKPRDEVIVNDGRLFVRSDGSKLSADTWVVYDVTEGSIGWGLIVRNYGDPRVILAPLLGVIAERDRATEMLAGDSASRVEVVIEPERAVERLPPHLVKPYEDYVSKARDSGAKLWQDFQVWLASDGRLLRMRFRSSTPEPQVVGIVTTYDLSGMGEAITFAPDPDHEVLTLEQAQERYRAMATASPAAP